jgi:hypothetical protein
MLKGIARILLRSKINRDNLTRKKKFLSWEKIEKIALIIDKNTHLNKSILDKFVEETKKYIQVFYIEIDSKGPTYHDWKCFSKKDRSFFHLPKKKLESELKHKQFDVIINTCNENNLFSASLCSSLSAYLKCGRDNDHNVSDLVIKKAETSDLIGYLNDVIKYLKMIKA